MNLNDRVRVKLSERGRSHLRQHFEQLFATWTEVAQPGRKNREQVIQDSMNLYAPKQDGYTYTQLWDLMYIFGSACGLGRPLPFEGTEIELASEVLS